MATLENFGDTISKGIQDIAALLPLLGTDQCERHVGEALQKGYLYAAATPLSIFGSLGIVKVSFATFLATMTRPFHGGNWLDDAGFGTTGSVASMVTLERGTKRYGAEARLERLVTERHIDPKMISNVEWFGWRTARGGLGVGILRSYLLSWNLCLVLTSALASTFALVPYVYLLRNQGDSLPWLFPSLRTSGSFLCAVSVQLALQLRIRQITTSSLLLMKIRYQRNLFVEESAGDQEMLLEDRLMDSVPPHPSKPHAEDPVEDGHPETREQWQRLKEEVSAQLSINLLLVILQVSLLVGMGMVVAGYVGCFNLVSRTTTRNGPYVWFGVEAALSIARVILWGSNPSWDEHHTGIELELKLFDKSSAVSPGLAEDLIDLGCDLQDGSDPGPIAANTTTIQMFPIATSHLHELPDKEIAVRSVDQDAEKEAFMAHNLEDFLVAASPYIGPWERIAVDSFSVYYAVVLAKVSQAHVRKLLCATIVPHGAHWDTHSFLVDGTAINSCRGAFLSKTSAIPGLHAIEVVLGEEHDSISRIVLDREVFGNVIEYSNMLFRLLVMQGSTSPLRLSVSWSLAFPPTRISSTAKVGEVELQREVDEGEVEPPSKISLVDKIYMRIGQLCDLKGDRCLDRGDLLGGLDFTIVHPTGSSHDLFMEHAVIFDSAIQEIHLCVMEQSFVGRAVFPTSVARRLALQWIQKMDARISAEGARAILRLRGRRTPGLVIGQVSAAWASLSSELRSLRLLSADSLVLQKWKDTLDIVRRGDFPPVDWLFNLRPFTSPHVKRALDTNFLPFLTKVLPHDYHELVSFVKSSLDYLHSINSMRQPRWLGRIDPRGPGSPEFSPPYTFVDWPHNHEDLATDITSRIFLALRRTDAACDFLLSVPTSPAPLALTTIIYSNLRLTAKTARRLLSLLKKHRNITSVFYDHCDDFAGQEATDEVQRALESNRQKWREEASSQLCYQIGLDDTPHYKKEGFEGILSVQPAGRDLMLQHRVCVTAMIHIPVFGKILPILLVKTLGELDLKFTAILTFIPTNSSEGDRTKLRREKQVESSRWCKLRFDDFPQVSPGHYEMYVTANNQSTYLFRNLLIHFAPATRGLLRVCQGIFRDHSKATPRLGAREEGEEQDGTADAMDSQSPPDNVVAESATEQNIVLPHHQNQLQTISAHRPGGPASEALKGSLLPPLPLYRFEFSLRGPEGFHHGSFTFSPEGQALHLSKLDSLTMVLSLPTKKLRLDRYWSAPNPCPELSGAEEYVARHGPQEEIYAAWSEVTGSVESSGPGDLEGEPQGPGGAPETTDRDNGPIRHQNLFGVHYLFDDSGPGHSGIAETHGALVRQFISPPVYQFQFSFHGPKVCHHGTLTLRGKTRDSQLVNLTIALSPLAKELELQQHWFNPNSDRGGSFKVTEDDLAQADPVVSDKIFGIDSQASGVQEANPPEAEAAPDATGTSHRQPEEGDNRAPLVPPPSESKSDHRETKCWCQALRRQHPSPSSADCGPPETNNGPDSSTLY
ncbi:hypothetical protein PM082_011575 [Marasmius tenuissimus]|nr:hypothetical protein PM082_011575 [Marasmius tenuissimus]